MKYKIYETAKGNNEFITECAGGDFVNGGIKMIYICI